MNTAAVAQNITSAMKREGVSLRELAQKVGLPEATMIRYLSGVRQPTVYALYRISKVLGATMESLVAGISEEKGGNNDNR